MITIKLKREFFACLLVIFCIFLIFRFPDTIKSGITNGLQICFYTIIPSLFPFMVISSYIVKSEIFSPVFKLFSPITKFLFRQPDFTTSVILFSMIGGFPIGLKMINEFYEKEKITENEAKRLSLFCMNAGPSFIITALGVNMFKNVKIGIIIYFSLCLSSVILGIVSRFFTDKKTKSPSPQRKTLVYSSLSASVSDGLQGLLNICAWIVLFSALTECLNVFTINKTGLAIISSLIEISNGCINSVGKIPIPLFSLFIGFGGLCVHCQVSGYMKMCKIRYIWFLSGRIAHGVLSAITTHIILIFSPVDADVFANAEAFVPASFSVSLPTFVMLMIMCIIMIFDIDRKRKLC